MAPSTPSTLHSGQISLSCAGVRKRTSTPIVEAVLRARQTDIGDLAKADILAGLGLQRLVELDRVLVQLAVRIADVEQRQKTCCMPGGAGGEFLALDQDNV